VVQVRGFGASSLEDYAQEVFEGMFRVAQERNRIEQLRRKQKAKENSTVRAVRLIQDMAKIKVSYIKQRMMQYQQAEKAGRDVTMRKQKLLTWLALLSVLEKFSKKANFPDIKKERESRFLKTLPPPPPPPPSVDPPSQQEEELHFQYEAMKQEYEKLWTREGRNVLGGDKFQAMQAEENGHAEKEKSLIAQKCLERAMKVMSEHEHQDYIRKAWCLRNDWSSVDEVDPKEISEWAQREAASLAKRQPTSSRTQVD